MSFYVAVHISSNWLIKVYLLLLEAIVVVTVLLLVVSAVFGCFDCCCCFYLLLLLSFYVAVHISSKWLIKVYLLPLEAIVVIIMAVVVDASLVVDIVFMFLYSFVVNNWSEAPEGRWFGGIYHD